jgi:hypothetical protein
MNAKLTLPLAGAWFISIAGAYFIGAKQEQKSTDRTVVQSENTPSANFQRSSASLSGGQSAAAPTNSGAVRSSSSTPRSSSQTSGYSSISPISRIADPVERSRSLLNFIEGLSPDQFEAAIADFRASGMARERRAEYSMLLQAWGKVDPLAALAYTTENTQGDDASQEVLAAWASNNPTAALTWARENYTGDSANPYLVGVVKGLVDSNPSLATQVLQELPYSEERGEALRELIPYIAQMGINGANNWLSTIEDTRLINGASAYMAEHLARQSPESASEWAMSLPEGDGRNRAINEVMDTWARRDIEGARTWLDSLPLQDQLSAGPEFVSSLASQDANAAADWVDEQIDAPNYQELLKEFAQGATRSDPVLALNYGNELEDESDRSRTVGRALWTLYRQDKESARNWIQSNELPERVSRYVDRMLDN